MIVEQVYGPLLKFHLSQDNGAQSLIKWTRVYPVLKVGWANKGWPPQWPDRCRWSERLNCRRWWTTAIWAVSCCVEWRIPWLVCPCPLWTWWYSAVKWNANRNPMRPRDGKRFESDHSPWGFRNAACSRVQVKTSEIRESHSTHFSDNFIRKLKLDITDGRSAQSFQWAVFDRTAQERSAVRLVLIGRSEEFPAQEETNPLNQHVVQRATARWRPCRYFKNTWLPTFSCK